MNGDLTQRPAWRALEAHYQHMRTVHLRDFAKHRITDETLHLLVELATEAGLRERIDAMFRGEKINATENRAVLHVALRAPRDAEIFVDGANVVPEVHAVLDQHGRVRRAGARRRLAGLHRQADPQCRQHRHRRLRPGAGDGLRGAAPLQRTRPDLPLRLQRGRHRLRRGGAGPGGDETLFIVASKTFTTQETMTNARVRGAGRWLSWATRRPSPATLSPSPPTAQR
jgi:glucose-6-phosphate isomerase